MERCDSVAGSFWLNLVDALAGLVVLFESGREQLGAIFDKLMRVGRRLDGKRRISIFGGLLRADRWSSEIIIV